MTDASRNCAVETVQLPNGDLYVGSIANGKPHGEGVYSWADGSKYEGEWKDGVKHGRGSYVSANGDKYQGEYVKGQKQGYGITAWTNGSCHEGMWQNGREHGKGCYTTAGMCYIGNFTDGVIDGHGIHSWDDGSSFEGIHSMGYVVRPGEFREAPSQDQSSAVGVDRRTSRLGLAGYEVSPQQQFMGSPGASSPSGLQRHAYAGASSPSGLQRHAYAGASSPSGLQRHAYAGASSPSGLQRHAYAGASSPSGLQRHAYAGASSPSGLGGMTLPVNQTINLPVPPLAGEMAPMLPGVGNTRGGVGMDRDPGGAMGDNAFRQAQALPLAGGITPLMHAMGNMRGGMSMGPGSAMGDDDGLFNGRIQRQLFNGIADFNGLGAGPGMPANGAWNAQKDNPFAAGAWQGDTRVGARAW